MNLTAFPDHGWRFGKPKAFYIIIDDTNAIYETYSIATDSSDDERDLSEDETDNTDEFSIYSSEYDEICCCRCC